MIYLEISRSLTGNRLRIRGVQSLEVHRSFWGDEQHLGVSVEEHLKY